MVKIPVATALAFLFLSGAAAAGVDLGVNVNLGNPPARVERETVVIHEKETVVIQDKKDQGKHKGHYKNRKKGRK